MKDGQTHATVPDGPVYLTEDSPDANSKLCRVGMRIFPSVDGWPLHRVLNTIRKGMATMERKPTEDTVEMAVPPQVQPRSRRMAK